MLRVWIVLPEMILLPIPQPVVEKERPVTPLHRPELIVPGQRAPQHQNRGTGFRLLVRQLDRVLLIEKI